MTSNSQRAVARTAVADVPQHDRPISEQYRIVAKEWVIADERARLLDEMKTTSLEQQKQRLIEVEGDMPDSHAERRVKASPEWETYIRGMVEAKTQANLKRSQLKFLEIRFAEIQDANASSRAEMRLGRGGA